nr:hypothetical protein [Candidatus Sigynarchaeum springense]
MICPHGLPDENACPECSMLKNVKPLARASGASFTEMEIHRAIPTIATSDGTGGLVGAACREITTTLRIKRLSVDGRDDAMMHGNSTNLHTRLAQVLGKGFDVGVLDEGVKHRVDQVRKREINPHTKLE